MFDNWFSLPLGMLIASVSSTVGIGGGILWMPFLMIGLGLSPDVSVVTSLLIQTAGMGSGVVAYWRKDRIDRRLVILLLVLALPGIALGAWMTRLADPKELEIVLGMLTLCTAFLFVTGNPKYGNAGFDRVQLTRAGKYSWAVTMMATASGMLSVSIGEWLVPLMRTKMNLSMRVAVGTSIATIFGTCVLGGVFHLGMGGRPNLSVIGWAVPGVMLGGQIGPMISEGINDRVLKEVFVFLLTLIGIHLIYNSY
jgi:uncharacterized membrane protein YfcA